MDVHERKVEVAQLTLIPTDTSKLACLSTLPPRSRRNRDGETSTKTEVNTSQKTATMSTRILSSLPKIVHISPLEKAAGALTWRNLELATRALHHDGLVVLENAISHEKLDRLNEKMVEGAKILQAAGDASPYNYNKG